MQSDSTEKVAVLGETPSDVPPAGAARATDPVNTSDIAKELAAMKARIELLEAELKRRTTATAPAAVPEAPLLAVTPARTADILRAAVPIPVPPQAIVAQPTGDSSTAVPAKKGKDCTFLGLGLDLAQWQSAQQGHSVRFEILYARNPR